MLAVKCGSDGAASKLIEHGADMSVKNKVVQLCVLRVLQLLPCTRVMSSNMHRIYLTKRSVIALMRACLVVCSVCTGRGDGLAPRCNEELCRVAWVSS